MKAPSALYTRPVVPLMDALRHKSVQGRAESPGLAFLLHSSHERTGKQCVAANKPNGVVRHAQPPGRRPHNVLTIDRLQESFCPAVMPQRQPQTPAQTQGRTCVLDAASCKTTIKRASLLNMPKKLTLHHEKCNTAPISSCPVTESFYVLPKFCMHATPCKPAPTHSCSSKTSCTPP